MGLFHTPPVAPRAQTNPEPARSSHATSAARATKSKKSKIAPIVIPKHELPKVRHRWTRKPVTKVAPSKKEYHRKREKQNLKRVILQELSED